MSGRCLSCNIKLSPSEMCRKHSVTGEYLQLCNSCLKEVISIVNLPITGDVTTVQVKEEEDVQDW